MSRKTTASANHTNHTVERTAHADPGWIAGGALSNSCARLDFLRSKRDAIRNVDDVIAVLNDDTVPIRRVPTDASPNETFATVIFELGDEPRVRVRGGTGETDFVIA